MERSWKYNGEHNRPQQSLGFTLLELVVVVVIISILATLAINRLLILSVRAEQAAMYSVLGNLRSAIGLQIAAHIARDEMHKIATLAGGNPMDLLAEPPQNYLGVRAPDEQGDIEGGQWVFEHGTNTLIYHVSHKDYFLAQNPGSTVAKFKLQLVFDDIDKNAIYDRRVDRLVGLKLGTLEPYKWTLEPIGEPIQPIEESDSEAVSQQESLPRVILATQMEK